MSAADYPIDVQNQLMRYLPNIWHIYPILCATDFRYLETYNDLPMPTNYVEMID